MYFYIYIYIEIKESIDIVYLFDLNVRTEIFLRDFIKNSVKMFLKTILTGNFSARIERHPFLYKCFPLSKIKHILFSKYIFLLLFFE